MGAGGVSDDEPAPTLDELIEEINRSIDLAEKIKFTKSNFQHQVHIGLFLSMVEIADAIRILCSNERYFDAKVLLRTLVEHAVELESVFADGVLFERLKFEQNIKLDRTFAQAARGNPFMAEVAKHIDVATERRDLEKQKAAIAARGGKKVTLQDRFTLIGWQDAYESVYRSLSNLAHPTYSGIIERHMVVTKKTGEFTMTAFRLAERETIDVILDTTPRMLRMARERIQSEYPQSAQ